jgi:hypothetical protein
VALSEPIKFKLRHYPFLCRLDVVQPHGPVKERLLANASRRAFDSASTVGSSMVVVDALDETSTGLYSPMDLCDCPNRCGWFCQCAWRHVALGDDGRATRTYRNGHPKELRA